MINSKSQWYLIRSLGHPLDPDDLVILQAGFLPKFLVSIQLPLAPDSNTAKCEQKNLWVVRGEQSRVCDRLVSVATKDRALHLVA